MRGEPIRPGGAELETEVADRAAPAVLRHVEKLPGGRHASPWSAAVARVRTTIGRLLGLDASHWVSLAGLTSCCWSVLGQGAAVAPAGAQLQAPCASRCSATTTETPPGPGFHFPAGRRLKFFLFAPPSGKNTGQGL
ncbi:hypothetical protein SFUMM280S_02275 [Streptomyces fumanus]